MYYYNRQEYYKHMRDYELLKQIGRRVRLQREFLGYTRDHLAELLGVSVNFCSDIELGKKGMSLGTLVKMAEALHVSTDFIVLGKLRSNDSRSITALLESCDESKQKYLEEIIKNFIHATE